MSERYELKGKIGEGGIGTVHKAFDTQLKREVAIKRLIPVEGGNSTEAADNLIKEATTLSALQHPNIVTVYDVGTDDKGGFVVMELLKGETFDETIARGALTYDDFRVVVTQTLEALIAAHHVGLIHRDLKPSNLMVNWMPSGKFQIKILDFGLAKFSKQPSVQTIDQGDAILGSIYFMAPEQFERIALDVRTDLYSMGCMYYQCLTGKYPFDGDTAPQVMASHLQNRVTPLNQLRPDVPAWACDWVMWLISRKMEERPQSAKLAYEQFQAEKSSPANEVKAAAIATAAAVTAQHQSAPALPTAAPPTTQLQTAGAVPPGAIPPQPYQQPPMPGAVPPPVGFGAGPPASLAPKPSFPVWAMITIPVLLVIVIITAVSKFGGRGEIKKNQELVVKLHEQIDNGETPQGNRATVDVVVDYMIKHTNNKDTVNSAFRILGALEGDGVDGAIVDSLPKLSSPIQLRGMITTIAEREYKAGLPAIMKYATNKDVQVRETALYAVLQLGGKEKLPELIGLAVASLEADGVNPYEKFIVAMAQMIEGSDARSAAIREAAEKSTGKTRGGMLKLLGPLGGDAALTLVKKALNGSDQDAKIGALRGLADWPDSAPADLLFNAAKDDSDSNLQIVAVHAYVQNIAKPSAASAQAKIDKIEEIYEQIKRPKDKKVLLQALRSIIDPAARKFAESIAEKDPSMARNATGAAAHIKEGLKKLAVVKDEEYLEAEAALPDGFKIRYNNDPKMRSMVDWTHSQDRVYWPVRFEDPGTYAVYVTQSCDEDDKDSYEVSVAGETLEAEVIGTGDKEKFKTKKIGEVKISEAGGYTLTVAPKRIRGKLLMNLKQIRLKKVEG